MRSSLSVPSVSAARMLMVERDRGPVRGLDELSQAEARRRMLELVDAALVLADRYGPPLVQHSLRNAEHQLRYPDARRFRR